MTDSQPGFQFTARLNTSPADDRRGVVRLHPDSLALLGVNPWDVISIAGGRQTSALVATPVKGKPVGRGEALLDEVTMSNAHISAGSKLTIAKVIPRRATRISVTGSPDVMRAIDETTLRQALQGKVVSIQDAVSLRPMDLKPGASRSGVAQQLSRALNIAWTSELLRVTAVDPQPGPVVVSTNSAVGWGFGVAETDLPTAPLDDTDTRTDLRVSAPASPPPSVVAVADLAGVQAQAAKLREWLSLALDEPDLLKKLGASSHLGVLITGPAGVGKATLARAVTGSRRLVELDGPAVGATDIGPRLRDVSDKVAEICSGAGGVLLITDIDALLPTPAEPVATLILDQLRAAVALETVAVLATTSNRAGIDPRLRAPELCDREVSLPLPTSGVRAALLEQLLRNVPTDGLKLDEISSRTPGFVAADLTALVREAALRAAARASREQSDPMLLQEDLAGALEVIRPLSRSGSEELAIGSLSLADVGDMAETKQALTEAVLWPLKHPDSFQRLGIEPPRGVLLYGPPGCGKTFLVRALAGSGQVSVHAVKGAELMDKWVGSSERAVRELFQRARDSAPSLIFLDEVDALAPRRGQSSDSGVSDRIVAALLTELDGVEPLRDVVVIGATNRPELIDPALTRPGRLERLVFVPPPDADARAEILGTAAKSVPLAKDVNLRRLARELEGYSAADCSALLREAALAAMRRDVEAGEVTAADVGAARKAVRPSLDPVQVEALRLYAAQRESSTPPGDVSGYV
ncbi:AAA family ATPase [Nocardia sp. NPDC059239]|uniref:AAA family ATPase n=1 Tax=unclassified Nocardia TaxID=2637762 RepID=UPI00367ACB02